MFKTNRNHREFCAFLQWEFLKLLVIPQFFRTVLENAAVIYKVVVTDLTPVRDLLAPTYNPRGQTPWDPTCLFRSYWLMLQYGRSGSITHWVHKLKSEPLWAILSGFHPDDVPSIGAFYGLEERLCDFDLGQRVERTRKMRKPRFKPREKLKSNEKKPPRNPGVVRRTVARIMRDETKPQPIRADETLQLIFKECFVMPSLKKGLLGDPDELSLAGDGMVIETGGSPYGIKECDCWRRRGIFICGCNRRFSDPTANWGWDSYRKRWVYGYSNYTFTAADSPHDLPIYSTLAQASRHDSVTHNYALFRMRRLYPEINFAVDILDSAHDNYATYELLLHWGIEPFIDLNKTNKDNRKYTECAITLDEQGTPVCKCGHKMCYWGPDNKRYRHKWRCPHVVKKSVNCPYFDRPEGDYGRTYYTKSEDDIRLFTPTPRGTKKWKKTMNKRTSSERRNSKVKTNYALEQDRVRSKSRWLIRTIMRDGATHADAWVKTAEVDFKQWLASWLDVELEQVA